jgi:hypothetical protein
MRQSKELLARRVPVNQSNIRVSTFTVRGTNDRADLGWYEHIHAHIPRTVSRDRKRGGIY